MAKYVDMNPSLMASLRASFNQTNKPARLWSLEEVNREQLILPSDVSKKRFVFISDTHGKHEELSGLPVLPDGDVLLHGGDVIPNLGGDDEYLLGCYREFLEWIVQQSSRYEHIVLIGGNHDTILDWQKYPHFRRRVKPWLDNLPANVTYLHYRRPMITIHGITIYGSPTCVCRWELANKRMVSDAFERSTAWREQEWNNLPIADIDILLTHIPPEEVLCARKRGCPILSKKIRERGDNRIKFHCFGHEHESNGITRSVHYNDDGSTQEGITFINGAQPVRFYKDKSCKLLHQRGVHVFDFDVSDINDINAK